MLERIDEQTAAMSQRSERLKMMKLQYQMYFAKLVQNQTLRCIQQTTTATGAPSTAGGAMPIPVVLQPQPQVTNPQPTPQNWTFAMATPTQAGMVLTPQFAAGMPGTMPYSMATPVAANPAPHPVYYPEMFGGTATTPLGTSNLFDLRATLRAFDNENADLPERMQPHLTGDYQAEMGGRATPATPTAATSSTSNQEKGARQLSSTSSTLATSSLTFDKLPKTPPSPSPSLTLTELPNAGAGAGAGGGAGPGPAAASGHDVGGPPQREADDLDLNLDAWTNSRVTKVEYEKSPTVVGHNEPGQRHHQLQQQQNRQQQHPQQQQQQQQQHDFEAYFGELKIDEPWQDSNAGTSPSLLENKRPPSVRSGEMAGGSGMGAKVGINNDLLDEVKASRAALERAAAAVDEQLARSNQLSPPVSQETTPSYHQPKPGMSIENIENAIYGERLIGNATSGGAGAVGATTPAGGGATPTQGFFENLVSNTSPTESERREVEEQQQLEPEVAGYGQYEASSYGDASEPIYASIDSGNLQPENAAVEPLYSEIGNPTDYQAYGTDAAGAAGDAPAQATASEVPAGAGAAAAAGAGDNGGELPLPQEYSNIDYGNYEADQYAGGYDPNAYPGYIYDETTGQYIADPNATQYAPDGSYAGQEYDANAVQNYDYSAYEQHQQQQPEQQQQSQEELQPQEAYPVTEKETPEAEESPAAAPAAPEPSQATNKPLKPTSILSTTDKQAAPNDAQQQQQQKKKKRVNFVDSSETDDSSSAKPTPAANPGPAASTTISTSAVSGSATSTAIAANASSSAVQNATTPPVGGSESDFDFSTGSEAKN
ncbi:hypothetical protein KR200_003615 [Drosophila serrata]|nr:hypothetical protein KR200_003615 [Drosophila serrata]